MSAKLMRVSSFLVALGLAAAAAGCSGDDGDGVSATTADASTTSSGATSSTAEPVVDPGDGGNYSPELDPTTFADVIDNPYLPMAVGSEWVYEGESDGEVERIEVTVTGERKEVLGIDAYVVRDTVTVGGDLVEDTYDWFAQDADGNVWYLGEASSDYENGEVVSTAGSWEAGVDGALPGIVMPADPAVGDSFRQEYYVGEAEDMMEILEVGASLEVLAGSFDDVVKTEDWTPLEPDAVEKKYYALGVGRIREVTLDNGESADLVEYTLGA